MELRAPTENATLRGGFGFRRPLIGSSDQQGLFIWRFGMAQKERRCRVCGCTDDDCRQCIEKTGEPCHWVEEDLCSACTGDEYPGDDGFIADDEDDDFYDDDEFEDDDYEDIDFSDDYGEAPYDD
jgi:hypothetical protein